MKKQFVFAVVIAACTFFSCKKSDPTPAVVPAEGNWVGKYGSGGGPEVSYYAFQFDAGGVVSIKANDILSPNMATGIWSISNDSIRSTYTYAPRGTFSMIGKYDGHSNTITGTWGSGNSNKDGGTFTITKQ